MFTGIVTSIGKIASIKQAGDLLFDIECDYNLTKVALGASIACDGVCLTVTSKTENSFRVAASAETCAKTTLSSWRVGRRVNLEQSLRLGDEMGGHIVLGHVDGVAKILKTSPSGDSTYIWIKAPDALAQYIAPKGSVALNGTSLTVNAVEGADFSVNLIAHTKSVTTWDEITAGEEINLEVDTIARYVARINQTSSSR